MEFVLFVCVYRILDRGIVENPVSMNTDFGFGSCPFC
jgi:hypothetical protein